MITPKETLDFLLRAIQFNRISILGLLKTTMAPSLRKILKTQLHELEAMETEIFTTAASRGWDPKELDTALGLFSYLASRLRLSFHPSDSRVAAIQILSNTRAMTRNLTAIHQCGPHDIQLHILSQKHLDCETAYIHQLRSFL